MSPRESVHILYMTGLSYYWVLSHSRGERKFPFPTIPRNTGLLFPFPIIPVNNNVSFLSPKVRNGNVHSRSQKLGMEFSFPFPKVGNVNYHSHPIIPIPKIWEWTDPFPFLFLFPKVQKLFPFTPILFYLHSFYWLEPFFVTILTDDSGCGGLKLSWQQLSLTTVHNNPPMHPLLLFIDSKHFLLQ